jgi:DNA mismatch repair protein MutS2
MDEHTLRVLDFSAVLELLIERTETTLGAERAAALLPLSDVKQVYSWQQLTSEARLLIEHEQPPSLASIRDIGVPIARAQRGGSLNVEEMMAVYDTLIASRRIHDYLTSRGEKYPQLTFIARNISPQPQLEQRISNTFGHDGLVKDSASAELARIRRSHKAASGRLVEKMQRMLNSSGVRTALQEPILTQRDGRYCLPIKAEYRGRIKGIVHDTSASGATLYVEPEEAIVLGNEVREHESAEKYEVERILSQLSSDIGVKADELGAMLDASASLDLAFAKGKLSDDLDCIEPKIRDDCSLYLRHVRHPLIPKESVVPINVELGRSIKALLITGPNTGGKTVALKTVGLAVLMTQCGLHVLATDAQISVFPGVFADIGDEQSIHQSLSTFSAHLHNIIKILNHLEPGVLILLDEIGAGTDPTEGSALAKALLNEFVNKGARVMCSTHYGELKAFAYNTPGFQNAAVEFDVATLKPTYRLKIGAPGASHALSIAERLGLPTDIVEKAKEQLSEEDLDIMLMLQKLEVTQKEAELALEDAKKRSSELKVQQDQIKEEHERVEVIRREAKGKVQDQIRKLLDEIRGEARDILDQLRQSGRESKTTEKLRDDLKVLETVAKETAEVVTPKQPVLQPSRPLKKGDRVRVAGYEQTGTLMSEPKDGEVTVIMGSLRMNLPLSELTLIEKPEGSKFPRHSVSLSTEKTMNISTELYIRRMRAEEALLELDKYLDDASLAGVDQARIVHGKGTGTLRHLVREHLRKNNAVESFRDGDASEGGNGVTIVRFKR